ncbi:MAG: TenA family transcriptional regulator [Gemmatimonas sp.]
MESREQFEKHMAQVLWENRWKRHSTFEVWVKNHLSREGAGVFAMEHCVFADEFPRWFASIIANCPEADARHYMIENMYVEEVEDPTITTSHYESMVDFTEALGFKRSDIYAYKGRPYTKMALAYWDRAARALPWLEAFATVGGLEAARGGAVGRLGNTVAFTRRVWEPLGLSAKALEHWSAGEVADIPEGGHADMTLKILSKYATTEEKQQRVLACLAETMQIRWHHFDLIGRDAMKASGVKEYA